jgi:hypothetical protein
MRWSLRCYAASWVVAGANLLAHPLPSGIPVAVVVVILSMVLLIAGGLPYLAFSGRQWARWVFAVAMAYGTYVSFFHPNASNPPPPTAFGWVSTALQLACVGLMFLPDSTAWFKARGQQRAQARLDRKAAV